MESLQPVQNKYAITRRNMQQTHSTSFQQLSTNKNNQMDDVYQYRITSEWQRGRVLDPS